MWIFTSLHKQNKCIWVVCVASFLKQMSNHIWSYLFHSRLLERFLGKQGCTVTFLNFSEYDIRGLKSAFVFFHMPGYVSTDCWNFFWKNSKSFHFTFLTLGPKTAWRERSIWKRLQETPSCQEGSSFKAISGPQLRSHPDCCFWWIHSPIILPDPGSIECNEVWQRDVPEYKANSKVTHTFRIYEPI